MKQKKKRILTVPNLLSLLRLAMIPLLMWLYLEKQEYLWTAVVLVLSGATDIVDGMIARKFDMVSDFGKALDPVADKLTQIAMLYCLGTSFPEIRVLLLILVVKETITGAMSLYSIRKTGEVHGAEWHGKITTVLFHGPDYSLAAHSRADDSVCWYDDLFHDAILAPELEVDQR